MKMNNNEVFIRRIKQQLSRRKFLFSTFGLLVSGTILNNRHLRAANLILSKTPGQKNVAEEYNSNNLDPYGGLKSVRFDPTGFFRIEKADRWWFVTPEGSAFLSFGLNHPDMVYITQEYNVDFWKKKFGADDIGDQSFKEGFIDKVMNDLSMFGMNTIGTHARKEALGKITIPYIQGLFFAPISYWMNPKISAFPDVFSAQFEKRCDNIARRLVLPKKDDPYLLGYTLTDSPVLTDVDAAEHGADPWGGPAPEAPTWPRVIRNLNSDSPGKKVYISLIKERYSTIKKFNKIYKTQFSSFADLEKAKEWSSFFKDSKIDDCKDNHAFLMMILKQYYLVANAAIRKYDTNHLILGDIINAQTPPPDDVISFVAEQNGVISYQFYGSYDEQSALLDRWSKLTGKPLFHADSSFSVGYKEMPNPIGAVCPDQNTRASKFLDFATRAFPRTDFLGWNWCGWMDAWPPWKAVRQHTGLQDPFGNYNHPMPETMSWFGSHLYDYGLGENISDIKKPL
jgi:hypothetical protein